MKLHHAVKHAATIGIMTAGFGLWATPASAVKIAENGQAQSTIVVAPDAPASERHAANELANFLGQVSGAKFTIAAQPQAGVARLWVGAKAAKLADPNFSTDGLGDEGIIIRTIGNDLILAGGEPRGTLYAVYTFLEDNVGCHWWSPTASTIPHKPTLAFENLNVRYVPPIEYRDTNYANATEADFSVRNKFNGHHHRLFISDGLSNIQQDNERGGRKFAYVRSDRWGAHGLWTLIPPPVYFKDHPEWFSMIDGKRTAEDHLHSALCLTNEEMQKKVVENSLLALWGNPHTTILSIEQWDDGGPPDHCQCDKCMAIEKEEGSAAGVMVRFANTVVADFEKQADKFERKAPVPISILAYHYTQKPPLHAKPDPRIIVRMCPIHADYSVPLSDDRNKEFRDDFTGWSKICNRLYIWYYGINFGYMMLPNPNLRVIGSNMRYLVNHNVKGLFTEADSITRRGAEMAELRAWLIGRLSWNPELDSEKLIEQFTAGYYGPAGKHIKAYLDVMHDSLEASGEKLGIDMPPTSKFLNFKTLNAGWLNLKAAEAAVQDNPTLLDRVQEAQLPVMYAFIMNWEDLSKQAQAQKAVWPMPQTLKEAHERFVAEAVGKRGIPLSILRLPAVRH